MPQRAPDDRYEAQSAGSVSGPRELRLLLRSPAQLERFRQQLRSLLVTRQAAAAEREAIVLATEEALNNALLACEAPHCRVEAIVSLIADYVCVEVRDAGVGAKGVCVSLAKLPEGAEHGRGLYLMGQLMESLELVARSRGTLVRMTKRLRRLESPGPDESGRLAG